VSLLFIEDGEFPAGINGLVANRLAEEFYRPAVVVRTGEYGAGELPQLPEFNIITHSGNTMVFSAISADMPRRQVLQLPTGKLPKLKQGLQEIAAAGLKEIEPPAAHRYRCYNLTSGAGQK